MKRYRGLVGIVVLACAGAVTLAAPAWAQESKLRRHASNHKLHRSAQHVSRSTQHVSRIPVLRLPPSCGSEAEGTQHVSRSTYHAARSTLVQAQENELRLSLNKQFGFAMGGQIQGTFKLSIQGPDDLASVTFELNDQAEMVGAVVLGEVSEAPFSLTFSTDAYSHGHYELSAVGQTVDGRRLRSNVLRVEFVSAEAGWRAALKIMVPVFVLVGLVMLASFVGPLLLERRGPERRSPGEPRNYGLLGGTVCPKCGRPFSRHWWGLNMVVGKFDRCPRCGKWSLVCRASRQELAAAEAAELAASSATPQAPELSPEEKLRRQIEESKYM